VVNSDQIGMHLMPIVGKCTWEGIEDKGQETNDVHYFIMYEWIVVSPSSFKYTP